MTYLLCKILFHGLFEVIDNLKGALFPQIGEKQAADIHKIRCLRL